MDEKERAILELQRKVDRIQKVTDKVGKMCYFERKELDAWLLQNHNGPDVIADNE